MNYVFNLSLSSNWPVSALCKATCRTKRFLSSTVCLTTSYSPN